MSEDYNFIKREIRESYYKSQLFSIWKKFNGDFEEYVSLSPFQLKQSIVIVLGLFQSLFENFNQELGKL
jgi:hypothetical protein